VSGGPRPGRQDERWSMKLEQLTVRNLRSLAVDPASGQPFSVDFAAGLTVLVGPNNCGKSNVVRALELALDPSHQPDPHLEAWNKHRREPIEIRLRFRADESKEREGRLLDLVRSSGSPTSPGTAGTSFVHRTVLSYEGDSYTRREDFGVDVERDDDMAARRLHRAADLFHECVGIVVTRSGEAVGSVLGGRFRHELTSLVRSKFSEGYQEAIKGRQEYASKLDSTLFGPLTAWLTDDLKQVFPDVTGVRLKPAIPEIDEMIASLGLEVEDTVLTSLEHKGSGVRSGLVAALLRYLAEHSETSTVFAVEEPEAFLHPGAQEAVRDNLRRLADRDDMSVLLTTHSPFMVPREADAIVVALAKDKSGRTKVTAALPGDAPLGSWLGGIFRDRRVSELLDVAARLPENARGVLVVEGTGDKAFIEAAAAALGIESLLEGIHIQASAGVEAAIVEFTMLVAQTGKPVGILLDCDDIGRSAFEKLRSKTFQKLVPSKRILSYRAAFDQVHVEERQGEGEEKVVTLVPIEYEAEDLFTHDFQDRFNDTLKGEIETYWKDISPDVQRLECGRNDAGEFKRRFMDFVPEHLQADDALRWKRLIETIAKVLT